MIQDVLESGSKPTIEPGSAHSKSRMNNPDGGLSQPDIKMEESDLTDMGEGTIPFLSTSTTAMEEQSLWDCFPDPCEVRKWKLQDEAAAGTRRVFRTIGKDNPTPEEYRKVYMSLLASLMVAYFEWKASSYPPTPEPK